MNESKRDHRNQRGALSARSRRRFGAVRHLPSGRYQASYKDPGGNRQLAPDTFPTRGSADRWLAGVEADISRGEWSDPRLRRIRMADWAEEWLATTVHLKPKTREGYESLLRSHVLPAFGSVELGHLDQLAIRRWIAELSTVRSPKTVANARQVVSLILDAAVGTGAIRANPCLGVKVGRAGHKEMHFLSPEEVDALADEIALPPIKTRGGEHRRESYPAFGLLVRLGAWTGLRAGELGALRRGRIDLLRGQIEVAESVTEVHGKLIYGPTKTYERRTVPLLPSLRGELAEHLISRSDPEDLVFTAPEGGPLRHKSFYARYFKPAVNRLGVTGVRFHDLRHSFAAFMIAQGAHPRAIMERMGHSSITVTLNTYGHLLPKIDQAITDSLDDMFQSAQRIRQHPDMKHQDERALLHLRPTGGSTAQGLA